MAGPSACTSRHDIASRRPAAPHGIPFYCRPGSDWAAATLGTSCAPLAPLAARPPPPSFRECWTLSPQVPSALETIVPCKCCEVHGFGFLTFRGSRRAESLQCEQCSTYAVLGSDAPISKSSTLLSNPQQSRTWCTAHGIVHTAHCERCTPRHPVTAVRTAHTLRTARTAHRTAQGMLTTRQALCTVRTCRLRIAHSAHRTLHTPQYSSTLVTIP